MTIAAFFDMDRTLLRCNTGTLWVRFLRRRGEIGALGMLRAFGWLAQYKLSVLDMEALTERVMGEMAGDSEAEMIEKCRLFTDAEVLPQVAKEALLAIERHRRQGHLLVILTSSTPYVTEPLARHLGIDHVLCTRLGVREGRFDGTYTRPACYGRGKVHWAEAFAQARGVDLDASWFYTDSYSDLPMLERVGQARVINPDPRLRRFARRRGWTIDFWGRSQNEC